jgi:mono/diheme cytochrome c family protein
MQVNAMRSSGGLISSADVRNLVGITQMQHIRNGILLTLLLLSSQARAQDVGDSAAGFALAKGVCAECHAVDTATRLSPNPEAPRFEVIANTPGMTATALTAALRTPHRTMPNLMLDRDELRNVIAYILSLKRAS